MKHIFVRPGKVEDLAKCVQWTIQNLDKNSLDPEVLNYPSTFTLAAYDADGPIMYMPVQTPLMMESVCSDPDASPAKQAMALKEIVQALVTACHVQGRGEIYFIGSDEQTSAYAENQIFERVDAPVYRVRLSKLESK